MGGSNRALGWCWDFVLACVRALFLDIPYIVDSFTRRADYFINRFHDPKADGTPSTLRSRRLRPSYGLLLVVLFFTAYGPTYNSLCGLGLPGLIVGGTKALGGALLVVAYFQIVAAFTDVYHRVQNRMEGRHLEPRKTRWGLVQTLLGIVAIVLALPLVVLSIVYFQIIAFVTLIDSRGLSGWKRDQGLGPWKVRWGVGQLLLCLVAAAFALPLIFLGIAMLVGDMPSGCHVHDGHTTSASIVQAGALMVAIGIAYWSASRKTNLWRLFFQAVAIYLLLVMTACAGDWTGADHRSEALQVPYLHVFAVVAASLATISWLSPFLVWLAFRSVSDEESECVRKALSATELFADERVDPHLSWRRVVGGFFIGLIAKPLQFFVIPAFAVLLVPADWLKYAWPAGLFASAMLVTAGSLTSRWSRMLEYLRRYFLLGTPAVVSVAVIVVAALRLFRVQYVSTLLDVAPFGMPFLWMIMAYTVSWWFEYQVNSVLAAKVLQILRGVKVADLRFDIARDDDLVPYTTKERKRNKAVDGQNRSLTGHGMGELIAVGTLVARGKEGQFVPAFEATSIVGLFDKLLGRDNPAEAHEMIRRVELYFGMLNALILAVFVALAWNWGRDDRLNTVHPVVTAAHEAANAADKPADLLKLLTDDPDLPKGSAIMVSASGGGTRAALYTAMTLQGLHDLHVDDRVVLLSGVSGGAVASAYFYGHREELLQDKSGPCAEDDPVDRRAWDCYERRMSMPFIDDVMRGASEWRIQSEQPLGILLAESFDRRLFKGDHMTVASRSDVGLILNTTVSGHPLQDAKALDGTLFDVKDSTSRCGRAVSALGGGRLAFSNLAEVDKFSKTNEQVPSIGMPFVVVRDHTVGLAQAAALSANFPPVFPNARVNLTGFKKDDDPCDIRSYFVTDGGATENLSLVSTLLAIQSALENVPAKTKLRRIDIVLAEASAMPFDYTQDRGIGAATDQAKERLTGRLTLELLDQLKDKVTIDIHDLSLPRVFRSRGGFGTHWEFPGTVRLEDPLDATSASERERYLIGSERDSVSIDQEQLMDVWKALFAKSDGDFCDEKWNKSSSRDLGKLGGWICGKEPEPEHKPGLTAEPKPKPNDYETRCRDPQLKRWAQFKAQLAASSPPVPASTPALPPPADPSPRCVP